jgi:hypothetical protein
MKILSNISLCVCFVFCTSFQPKSEWVPLLDKSLSKWGIYQSYRHKDGYKGEMPKDANGKDIPPVGYNKNEANEFSVEIKNGEPVLKITGEIYGCLYTKQEFENYDLKLKYKWGTKKWIPRINEDKDSGLLYHSQGKCGVDYWRTWMLSQEFQIVEKSTGDYWSQSTSQADIKATKSTNYRFDPNGKLLTFGSGLAIGNFCQASENMEKVGDWNEIELITVGDKSLHIVNGKVVNVLLNSKFKENGILKPLVKGKLQIQSEAAEVYYKDILIRPISKIPAKYLKYFN